MFHSFQPRHRKLTGKQGKKEEKEFDFVIVFPGLIIGIECKTTLSGNNFKKATKQLDRLQQVLEEEAGIGPDFKFIRCMAYGKTGGDEGSRNIEQCQNCSKFLLKFEDTETFMKKLTACLDDVPMKPESKKIGIAFKATVRDLLFYTSKKGGNEETRVADAYSTYHELMTSTPGEAAFFWNPAQYDIIKQDPLFCTIQGGT